MQWKFKLINRHDVETIIDEPNGWANFITSLKRHPERHGTFRELQSNTFQFFEKGGWLLKDEYDAYGLKSDYRLIVEVKDKKGWFEAHRGIISFANYTWTCDKDCSVSVDVDMAGPLVQLINNFDKQVDITSLISLDKTTTLDPYDKIDFPVILPSKTIILKSRGDMNEPLVKDDFTTDPFWTTNVTPNQLWAWIIPGYSNIGSSSIPTTTLFDKPEFLAGGAINQPPDGMTPTLIVDKISGLKCIESEFIFKFRNKGSVSQVGSGLTVPHSSNLLIIKLPAGLDPSLVANYQTLFNQHIPFPVSTGTESWDVENTVSASIAEGDQFWYGIFFQITPPDNVSDFSFTQDIESYFEMTVNSLCDPSPAKVSMINEATSRVIESITNSQLKLYSDYFGRPDSQPFSFPGYGCGSLRTLTNGLKIRQVKLADGTEPAVTMSLQDIFNALVATDNIGLGMEGDSIIRMENWKYFYSTEVIHQCRDIAKIQRIVQPKEHYSIFKVGYDKWAAIDDNGNGLDEFLTNREYHLDIPQIQNTLEQICKFIVSGYATEITRRKGNDASTSTYDNNVFMICMAPDGGNYIVELNNITDGSNMADPATVYNFRLSPARNALRWFDRVIGSYRNVTNDHKIFFAQGEGNYIAKGMLSGVDCRLEAAALGENDDLSLAVFADPTDGQPIRYGERVKYTFPLGLNDYKKIQKNPNGLIQFTSPCENGYGWIDQLDYRWNNGDADFTLIPQIR